MHHSRHDSTGGVLDFAFIVSGQVKVGNTYHIFSKVRIHMFRVFPVSGFY